MQAANLPFDVPNSLAQVLHCVAFAASPPKVLDGVADAEILVLADRNGFNARFVTGVMSWMVDGVVGLLHAPHTTQPRLAV